MAEHVDELLSRLDGLCGLPIRGVATTASGTVRTTVPGWAITVAGVAAGAQAAFTAAAEQHDCYLGQAGRYGQFWWVAVEYQRTGDRRRAVVLGSLLVLTKTEDGHPRTGTPVGSPLQMIS
jgi:hypothetical protein